jgi:hypothetical protein
VSFDARVYRVLIASPGDLNEERGVIEAVITDWNVSHAADEGMVLLPVRWENAVPEYGERPQAILNRRLVGDCDILIGAFWSRVGTPTGASESGTVEEIEHFARARKPVLLYFSSRQMDLDRVDTDQLTRVRELRSRLEQVALVGQFSSVEQLEARLTRDLIQQMRRLRSPLREVAAETSRDTAAAAPPPPPAAQSSASPRERLDAQALDELYEAFWTRFSELVARSGIGLRPPTPRASNYVRFSLGSSDRWMNAFASVRDRYVGVELVLRQPRYTPEYGSLEAARVQIEQELGTALEWKVLPDSYRIALSEYGVDIQDRADWSRQHDWLIQKVKAFQQVLLKRIEAV